MMPVTYFAHGMCDLSPHNRPTGELEESGVVGDPTKGLTNCDFIYISEGCKEAHAQNAINS